MKVFEELESEVRTYCRSWPTVFSKASGSHLYDENGRDYIDFFAGAGALNYGHNHRLLKNALLRYLGEDSIVHGMDFYSAAKGDFLEKFNEIILTPRGLVYKIQFPGPAGTIAVEAALKLARKVTQRNTIVSFEHGFHGMTLGALALTSLLRDRGQHNGGRRDTIILPYDDACGHGLGDAANLDKLERLATGARELVPAAVIVETVQGDGGLRVASDEWLDRLARLCKEHGMLLIVDDVQMGCGRTGPFFSFERSGIYPDIVCLSKSLSGYGLPLAVTLLRPELDIWAPGEHTGTFRGTNPAFVTATAALDFWRGDSFELATLAKGNVLRQALEELAAENDDLIAAVRGRGMAQGIMFRDPDTAKETSRRAFEVGLLVEVVGELREVVKVMPPLTIDDEDLARGLQLLRTAVHSVALKRVS
jgi:diaminobutyrate-2-oxoglutarate transaminase